MLILLKEFTGFVGKPVTVRICKFPSLKKTWSFSRCSLSLNVTMLPCNLEIGGFGGGETKLQIERWQKCCFSLPNWDLYHLFFFYTNIQIIKSLMFLSKHSRKSVKKVV